MTKTPEALMDEARPYLMKAVKYDQGNNPQDAASKYLDGCAKLLEAVRLMPENDSRNESLRQQIRRYMDRADELKPKKEIKVLKVEQRRIEAESIGHSYERVFSKCIDDKLTKVDVHDAYISAHHQMVNFVRFCELLVSLASNLRHITLTTGMEAKQNEDGFKILEQSLSTKGILLRVNHCDKIHDREIVFNNGWIVKIGRGLDYFKRVDRFALGAFDQNLRPCHETVIDIMKISK